MIQPQRNRPPQRPGHFFRGEREPGEPINMAHVGNGIALPEKGGGAFWAYGRMIDELQANHAYRNLDVRAEIEKMSLWLQANPAKRKVDTKRFMINWLNKAAGAPGKPGEASARAVAQYRERIHTEAVVERAKPEATNEVAKRAIQEAMAILGKGRFGGGDENNS